MKKVKACQDDSGHWYLIPNELYKEFEELLAKLNEVNGEFNYLDEFIDKFDKYRTGGSINSKQLYIES